LSKESETYAINNPAAVDGYRAGRAGEAFARTVQLLRITVPV